MRFPAKITSIASCIWVAIPVDWVIFHWYACGADGRSLGRAGGRCTVTWLPNFLGWVDYFILLTMVHRWRASRARAPLLSYKRRFKTTTKMDRHITWHVMWRSDSFPISDWVSLDVFAFLNSGCVTTCALALPHILLNEIVVFFLVFFFYLAVPNHFQSQTSFKLPPGSFITT